MWPVAAGSSRDPVILIGPFLGLKEYVWSKIQGHSCPMGALSGQAERDIFV